MRNWSIKVLLGFAVPVLLLAPNFGCPPGGPPDDPPTVTPPCETGRSLRIMTYNTALIFSYDSSMEPETRVDLIADAILADAPDVVILNEVFYNDEDGKDGMRDRLCPDPNDPNNCPYPYYVDDLSGGGVKEDSGLMLFSRFRFGQLDSAPVPSNFSGQNQGYPWSIVWKPFPGDMLNGEDWWASKGVAILRILNECNNFAPFNVAFTHMQSSSGGDMVTDLGEDMEDRRDELDFIREAIEDAIVPAKRLSEPVFLAGDLNINGKLINTDPDPVWDQESFLICPSNDVCVEQNFTEWEHTFDATNPDPPPISDYHRGFYSSRGMAPTYDPFVTPTKGTFFTDSWGFETSPLDIGQTQSSADLTFPEPVNGERLDYILHNHPAEMLTALLATTGGLCLQHITRGFTSTVKYGVNLGYSDHLPVTADFNTPAPRCSPHPRQNDPNNPNPWGPGEVVFAPEDPTASNHSDVAFTDGMITYPGSMQWYVIDQAYPYKIAIFGDHVAYDVYHGSDLSQPMPPWDGECEEVTNPVGVGDFSHYECTYTLYDPPYYVRVYAVDTSMSDPDAVPDRTRSGLGYSITFHRFTCSSIEDACPLKPAVDSPAWAWPAGPLNPYAQPPDDDTMFFVFTTEFARNGDGPEITFLLDSAFPTSPNPLTMTLVDENGVPVCIGPDCPNNDGLANQVPSPTDWSTDSNGDGLPERLAVAKEDTLPGEGGWPKRYYLKVKREPQYLLEQKNVYVRYETGLNYFRPTYLFCDEDRTDVGEDDVAADFYYDSVEVYKRIPGTFDDGDERFEWGTANWWFTWPSILDGAFLVNMHPWMLEDLEEDVPLTFQSVVSGQTINAVDKSTRIDDPVKTATYVWSDENNPDDSDYFYVMTYELSHERPACRGDEDCQPPRKCVNGACK